MSKLKGLIYEMLTEKRKRELLDILEDRFKKTRFINIDFTLVKLALLNNEEKLKAINEMELTYGEPNLVWIEDDSYVFVDFAKESPIGRRNCCYDDFAIKSRKTNKPSYSALGLAQKMGIEILTENDYYRLQELDEFDLKTSSWILTPENIRNLGGALFCDRRYNTVFTYHNSAESYYSSRGFRGKVKI